MANKTFNIYCDESCHLEHDHKRFMFIGNVSCAFPQVKRHAMRIKELKKKYNFYAEIKWTNVSMSKFEFYMELVEYFFDTDLRFNAVRVNKEMFNAEEQSYDDFYYKMYYQLLNYKVDTTNSYNVYLDIKDTWSSYKVKRLEEILNTKYGVFRKVQSIRSDESILLQLADFLIGALAYDVNVEYKANPAKVKILEAVKRHVPDNCLKQMESQQIFDLIFINLK